MVDSQVRDGGFGGSFNRDKAAEAGGVHGVRALQMSDGGGSVGVSFQGI